MSRPTHRTHTAPARQAARPTSLAASASECCEVSTSSQDVQPPPARPPAPQPHAHPPHDPQPPPLPPSLPPCATFGAAAQEGGRERGGGQRERGTAGSSCATAAALCIFPPGVAPPHPPSPPLPVLAAAPATATGSGEWWRVGEASGAGAREVWGGGERGGGVSEGMPVGRHAPVMPPDITVSMRGNSWELIRGSAADGRGAAESGLCVSMCALCVSMCPPPPPCHTFSKVSVRAHALCQSLG